MNNVTNLENYIFRSFIFMNYFFTNCVPEIFQEIVTSIGQVRGRKSLIELELFG